MGRLSMRRCSTVSETSVLVVSMGAVSADTMRVCTWPRSCSAGFSVAASPTVSEMARFSYAAKLAPPSTVILYRPGGIATRSYRPLSSVTAVRVAPVAALVRVTFAPFTARFCGSRTAPESVAVFTCAETNAAPANKSEISRIDAKMHRQAAKAPSLRCMSFPSCCF